MKDQSNSKIGLKIFIFFFISSHSIFPMRRLDINQYRSLDEKHERLLEQIRKLYILVESNLNEPVVNLSLVSEYMTKFISNLNQMLFVCPIVIKFKCAESTFNLVARHIKEFKEIDISRYFECQNNSDSLVRKSEDKNSLNQALLKACKEGKAQHIFELIKKGADVKACTKIGKPALHLAVHACNFEAVKVLISMGADPLATSMLGVNSLHVIAERKLFDEDDINNASLIVDMLVDLGLKEQKTEKNWTATHVAAANGNLIVLKKLINLNADYNALTKEKETPYDLAIKYGHNKISDYLFSLN